MRILSIGVMKAENIWTKVEVTWHSGKAIQLHVSNLIVSILRLEWAINLFEKRLLECEEEVIMILIGFCGQRVGILYARFESRHTLSRCLYVIFYYFLYFIASFTESAQTKYILWFHSQTFIARTYIIANYPHSLGEK